MLIAMEGPKIGVPEGVLLMLSVRLAQNSGCKRQNLNYTNAGPIKKPCCLCSIMFGWMHFFSDFANTTITRVLKSLWLLDVAFLVQNDHAAQHFIHIQGATNYTAQGSKSSAF